MFKSVLAGICNDMITCISGYKRYLRVRGVGYKFGLENSNQFNVLTIEVGYSHILRVALSYFFT